MKSFLALAAALFVTFPAAAADLGAPVVLVAKRQLHDRLYGATILVPRPTPHPHPLPSTLTPPPPIISGPPLPPPPPARQAPAPVFPGGPISSESTFALVQPSKNPGGRSVKLSDNLFAVVDGKLVDDVIEKDPQHARFVAGLVAWRSGE